MTGHAQGNQQFRNARCGKYIRIKFTQHQAVFLQIAESSADILAKRLTPRIQIAVKALRKAGAEIVVDLAPVAFELRAGAKERHGPCAIRIRPQLGQNHPAATLGIGKSVAQQMGNQFRGRVLGDHIMVIAE